MGNIKTTKLFTSLYQEGYHDELSFLDQAMVVGMPIDLKIAYDPKGKGAYTQLITKDTLKIVLGGGFIENTLQCKEEISFTTKDDVMDIAIGYDHAIKAINYHEMGHVVFTDMAMEEIRNYPKEEYRGLIHEVSNICEDPVVEFNICDYFKEVNPGYEDPSSHIDWLIQTLFLPQAKTYVDDGSAMAFLNYLLLAVRVGTKEIPEHNAAWDKYKEGFMPLLKDALTETDPTIRVHKQVVFAEYLFNNIKEIDWIIEDKIDFGPKIPGKPKKGKKPGKKPGKGPEGEGPGGDPIGPRVEVDGPGEGPTIKGPEGEGPGPDGKIEKEKPAPKEKEIPATAEDILDSIIEDTDYAAKGHRFVNCKDVLAASETVEEHIDQTIQDYIDTIIDTSNYLLLLKDRTKERRIGGFTRGRLNPFTAMQDELRNGCSTKLFDQKVRRGQDKDAIIYLLGDNSGSMSGGKSYICAQAMAVFAQACDWSGTPFEAMCFTKTNDCESGTAYTVIEKEEKDSFAETKTYFGVNDSSLIKKIPGVKESGIPFFTGNSEEWNIHYIYENRIKKSTHKNKILIVLCDGATCGSTSELKKVVEEIEEDGVIVIGVGICSELSAYYKNSKTFMNEEELKSGLAEFLVGILEEYTAN